MIAIYFAISILLYILNVPLLLACTPSHMGEIVNFLPFVIKCLITYI